MDDCQFRKLLEYFKLTWTGYSRVRKGVKKRISQHMQQLKCPTMEAYLSKLGKDSEQRAQCEIQLMVSISRFFRDQEPWKVLQAAILPELIDRFKEKISIWSAGCGCGEEVYSIKIVWECLKGYFVHLPKLEVIATDINPNYIDRARAGVYSQSSLKEVSAELRSKYFEIDKFKNKYKVKSLLKKDIIWKLHHLLSIPPGINFHVIFLRNNLLTYYQELVNRPAVGTIIEHLAPHGFLIIGSKESLPFKSRNLIQTAYCAYIFKKTGMDDLVDKI
jgi:chemotaxis methyl-accepting protein methylase